MLSCDHFDRIPLGSILALLISWFGIGFYCHKMRKGLDALISIAEDIFANLVPFFEKLRTGLLWIAIVMAIITLLMAIVGIFATRHCRGTFCNKISCLMQPPTTGQRLRSSLGGYWACTIFMILNYLMYVGWIAIFAFTVALITVYYSFSPICLPQSGVPSAMCFNFTSFGMLLANGNPHAAVNLILCGHPVSQFCKLTAAFTPWYLSAFIGCFLILIGLNHFTACLAANFAHSRRAGQYLAIISRSSTPEQASSSSNNSSEKSLTTLQLTYKGKVPDKTPPAYSNVIYDKDGLDHYERSPRRPRRSPPALPAKPKNPLPTPV